MPSSGSESPAISCCGRHEAPPLVAGPETIRRVYAHEIRSAEERVDEAADAVAAVVGFYAWSQAQTDTLTDTDRDPSPLWKQESPVLAGLSVYSGGRI